MNTIPETAISLHVVQIVNLSENVQKELMQSSLRINHASLSNNWHSFPTWFEKYNATSSTFSHSFCTNIDTSSYDIKAEFENCITWKYVKLNSLDSFETWLFYEPYLKQWLIEYNVVFNVSIPLTDDSCLLDSSHNRTSSDIYNELRDFFVVSDNINRKSHIISSVENNAKTQICNLIKILYDVNTTADEIIIPNSAGNITLFIAEDNLSNHPNRSNLMTQYFESAHSCAERIKSNGIDLDIENQLLYKFWGRFHTIIANDLVAPQNQVMIVHFQAQLMWAYLSNTERLIQKAENLIQSNKKGITASSQLYIDGLVNGINYAHFMNERFKRSIEGDDEKIYSKIENHWQIEASLNTDKEFATYLSEYIENNIQQQSLKTESQQNKVLSVIAVLGFLALIDTWAGFLDMLNETYETALENTILSFLFNGTTLAGFNIAFSLAVFILCIAAIVYFLVKK